VNVFYVPTCGFSAATAAFLFNRGVSYNLVNLDKASDVRRDLTRRLKVDKLTTPVVESGPDLLMAPPLSRLKELSDIWLEREQASADATAAEESKRPAGSPKEAGTSNG